MCAPKLLHAKHPLPVRSGYTLIELVTVISILGVLAALVGGPTLDYMGDMRASGAGARLASDIRYMQRMALASGLRTWVVIDEPNDRYRMYVEDPESPGKAGRVLVPHPLDQSKAPVQFGVGPFAGVAITGVSFNATGEVEFDNFGVPYDSNGVALTSYGEVALSGGIAVRVHPAGGMVEAVAN